MLAREVEILFSNYFLFRFLYLQYIIFLKGKDPLLIILLI